jgi:hypothetical protein
MTRQAAAETLRALIAMGTATPRQIKKLNRSGRIPWYRADLTKLETVGASVKVGEDRWEAGPEAARVYAVADWCEDDGTPRPAWNL